MTQWGLDSLFNPAKRHMDEEKRRLQSTREEVGDSSGGKRIDLTSGKVVIERNDSESDEAESGESAELAESAGSAGSKDEAADEPQGEPKTAAERARLRHRNRRATDKG